MSEALLYAEHGENMLCTKIVLNVRNNFCTQHVLPRFELGIFMYWTSNSMNNLSSYCGLVDAKIRGSDKDLPVRCCAHRTRRSCQKYDEFFFQDLWPSQKTQTLRALTKFIRSTWQVLKSISDQTFWNPKFTSICKWSKIKRIVCARISDKCHKK